MDQKTSGGTDKRNWRERLGIGSKDIGMKDMPRISEDFKPAAVAAKPAAPTVRPAPMAPRVVAKAASATPVAGAARPAAMAPDALANKLKAQRDAAEKLAEQRVQAARQRAEAAMAPSGTSAASNGSASKPKFSFADEEMKAANAKPAAAQVAQQGAARPAQTPPATQRPSALPPQAPAGFSPQIAPPRPQLGGGAAVPQRAPAAQAYPQGQVYGQQPPAYVPSYMPPSPQGYTQPPAYRSIDPASAYVPPPPFNPAPSFGPQTRQPYGAAVGQQTQPRLQVPPRGQAADYGYESQPRANSRLTNPGPMRTPAAYSQPDTDDIFEKPAPSRGQRRATANDYQQAYREVESGYDDEAPRSRVPWILAMLLAFVVVGFGSIWAYGNYIKPQIANTSTQSVPVVKAPETPTKLVPDADTPTPDQVGQPTKKQIYDRIVGDREVLGGQIAPTEVTPVQPGNNTQVAPASDPAAAQPAIGTGNDGTPLPLPPPPGGTGDGTQGSLEPAVKGDQQLTTITPAAGESQAADSSPAVSGEPTQSAATDPVITPPAPTKPSQVASAGTVETIQDTPEEPVTEPAAPAEKVIKAAPKKPAAAKVEKSLGAKPVVLVPPSKKIASAEPVENVDTALADSNGLYGDTTVGNAPAAGADGAVVPETPVKKRRTLLDLFRTKDNTSAPAETANEQGQVEVLPPAKAPQKVAAATPPPAVQKSTGTGAYVAQLASFKTKAEASQEYNRMRAKHGEIVGRYAPIVIEAQVAGTTRYRLNIGPMASQDVASNLCKSLFAAGERDCLVHRQ
jgi:SPOR domain